MPSPPSATDPANLTIRKPNSTNHRPNKRLKLEDSPSPNSGLTQSTQAQISKEKPEELSDTDKEDAKEDEDHQCSICLQPLVDRTVIPTCAHEFCFECILVWTGMVQIAMYPLEQSRKCPLCSQKIHEYLIHHIRSKYDYQKHYLAPLPDPHASPVPLTRTSNDTRAGSHRNRARERTWGRRARMEAEERQVADELDRAIARRKWVYEHRLFAKHIASNPYTRYRPSPNPALFASSPELISRATAFLRRELRVWEVDVEWLTTYVVSLMKSIDVRSEAAIGLLGEFLDLDGDGDGNGGRRVAEHFAHEVYSYLRSPYRDLNVYDTVVQYDTPEDLPPPATLEQSRRWRAPPSPSPSRSRSQPRSQSSTYSPERSPDDQRRNIRRSRSRSIHLDERPLIRQGSRLQDRTKSKGKQRDRGEERSRSWSRTREGDRGARGERLRKDGKGKRRDVEVIDVDMDEDHRHLGHPKGHRKRDRSWNRSDKRDKRDALEGSSKERKRNVEVIDVDLLGEKPYNKPPNRAGLVSNKYPEDAHAPLASTSSAIPATEVAMVERSVHIQPEQHTEAVEVDVLPTGTSTIPIMEASRPEKKKKPLINRNRLGLLGAVHAHLGTPTGRSRLHTQDEISTECTQNPPPTTNAVPSTSSVPSRKPDLLAHISDITSVSTPTSNSNATSPPDTPVSHDSDPHAPPRQSARDIMARTRARLAKLKNESVAGISIPASPSPVDNSEPSPSVDAGARERLLSRLEQAKRQAEGSPRTADVDTVDVGVQAEARLKKQAQVRVRLAAAKRLQEKEHELMESGNFNMGGGSREEELKMKIKGRQ
ncbi:hypothetical protein HWV62_35835 [Athelia sp. TMB]|nr:hypothetical protein HWV62_35835 [Athelia sp. TMB]